MAVSSAERQRRYRRHSRGDHSLCDPQRCDALSGGPAEADLPIVEPAGRGPRGQRLWDGLCDEGLGPAHLLLLDETCRIADRLDRLDELVGKRKSWLSTETDDGGRVIVVVDAVLAEARQHATALRALISDLTRALPKAPAVKPVQAKRGAGLADLVALADRRRSTAG